MFEFLNFENSFFCLFETLIFLFFILFVFFEKQKNIKNLCIVNIQFHYINKLRINEKKFRFKNFWEFCFFHENIVVENAFRWKIVCDLKFCHFIQHWFCFIFKKTINMLKINWFLKYINKNNLIKILCTWFYLMTWFKQ